MKLHKLNLIIKRFTATSQYYILKPLSHTISRCHIATPYIVIDIAFALAQFAEGVGNLIKYKSLFSSYFLIKRPFLPLLAPVLRASSASPASIATSISSFIFYRIFVYLLLCTLRVVHKEPTKKGQRKLQQNKL